MLSTQVVINAIGHQLTMFRWLIDEEQLSAEERAERAFKLMRHHADIGAECCCRYVLADLTGEDIA